MSDDLDRTEDDLDVQRALNDVPVLELRNVTRTYPQGTGVLEVFRDVNLVVKTGELVALVGPSGAGKSSLLHIAGLLEAPTSGDVIIRGVECARLPDAERTRIRREELGFVYQFHHLLPDFSALDNIVMPQRIAGRDKREARGRARQLLRTMALEKRGSHRPSQLSGGEQQRVAIARALANAPRLLLADEPTGNLDPRTSGKVFDALIRISRAAGLAAIVATHNYDLAGRMDRTVSLKDGALVEGSAH